jgi:hypothetical protein
LASSTPDRRDVKSEPRERAAIWARRGEQRRGRATVRGECRREICQRPLHQWPAFFPPFLVARQPLLPHRCWRPSSLWLAAWPLLPLRRCSKNEGGARSPSVPTTPPPLSL